MPQGYGVINMVSDFEKIQGMCFDYIIVGGGTSGCPLAATLSERFTVLLVERGGSPFEDPLIMEKDNFMYSTSQIDELTSTMQMFVSEEGVENYRGRVLGGSSAINGGVYCRTSAEHIASAGWDVKLVKEAYEWVESKMVFEPKELSSWQNIAKDVLINAGILPFNGFSLEHVQGTKLTASIFDDNGKRYCSAHLLEAGNPTRLTVLLNSTVKNILFCPGLFTICFAIVLKENEDNWYRFLQNLKITFCSAFRDFTFISDRHHGLISSIPKVFPNSFYSYCYWHLDKNLNAALPKRCPHSAMLLELFKKMVYASNHFEFEIYMCEFKDIGVKQANDFVDGIAYEHWAKAYFEGSRYGEVSSTLAKCFNSWISEARHLPITSLVDKVRVKMMAMMSERRDISSSWTRTLCPNMEKILSERINAGKSWLVVKSSDSVYEVISMKLHRVDLEQRSCSCNIWKIDGFPCAHALRCINAAGKIVYNFIDVHFSVTMFRSTYGMSIEPVANADLSSGTVVEGSILLPDVCGRRHGRPKKKRIPNAGS